MEPPTTRELIATRGTGETALVALFEENVDDVFRFCLARSGSQTAAEEATAEAFLAAARAFSAGRGGNVDRPWLFVVARRRLIDEWRSEERRLRRIQRVRELLGGNEAVARHPNDDDDDDLSERALAALGSLPPRQRAAVTLRYLDECSVAETADAMGIDYGVAESLLARGRRGFSRAWNATINGGAGQ